jgi:hypothetical protein
VWIKTYVHYHGTKSIRWCRLIVSVLAVGAKVRGFKLGRGNRFLRTINISSTPSFGGEVQQEAPSCKTVWQVNIIWKYEQKYFKTNFSFLSPIPPACYKMSLLVGLPESWTNCNFSPVDIAIPPWFSMRLGMNNRPVGCSELSYGMYCRVKWLSTDVSELRTASIIIPDDNHFTRQYIPEDNSEHHTRRRENLKSHRPVGGCSSET